MVRGNTSPSPYFPERGSAIFFRRKLQKSNWNYDIETCATNSRRDEPGRRHIFHLLFTGILAHKERKGMKAKQSTNLTSAHFKLWHVAWYRLENNITFILKFYPTILVIGLRWFFDMISEPWWPSDHEFESHHPYLFHKN
jgi:hypothetical protein